MFKSNVLVSSLLLSIHILRGATASLPRPSSVTNDDPVLIASANISESSPMLVATSVPWSFRNVVFNFTFLGDRIPKTEIENILTSADEAITKLVDQTPFESIANNRFEHYAPNGNTLISIQANIGETITWTLLFRVLQGLYRFMIGMGAQQQHCQQLDFTIALAGQKNIGLGIIRYFRPRDGQVRRRETFLTLIPLLNETKAHSTNESSSLTAPDLNGVPFDWPIPKTSLILRIYFLGIPIPKEKVKALLQGAIAQVRPKASSRDRDEDIENGVFDWILPSVGDGTRTGVTIFTYRYREISWEQLFQILFGLYQFSSAFDMEAKEHYQALGFRIIDRYEIGGPLGVGSLSYYPRRAGKVEKRANGASQESLLLPNPTSSALETANPESSTQWPVRDTQVVLDFIYFGQDVPAPQILDTLGGAQKYIVDIVRAFPHAAIASGEFHFSPENSDAYINVVTNRYGAITWLELSQILSGVKQFCGDSNNRVLVFDIDILGLSVGFGTLLYFEPEMRKRNANGTLTLPNSVATLIPYNIPNTRNYLDFKAFGQSIPILLVLNALDHSLDEISFFVEEIPDSPVSRNLYVYDDDFGVSMTISPSTLSQMTWSQLDNILTGLRSFMTGTDLLPSTEKKTYYQVLKFNMIMDGQGYIGTGRIDYKPPQKVAMEKRMSLDHGAIFQGPKHTHPPIDRRSSETVAPPIVAPNSNRLSEVPKDILLPGNTSLTNTDQTDIHFPIINTTITLIFTRVGERKIPIDTVSEFFDAVTTEIHPSVAAWSNGPVTSPLWYYMMEHARGGATLSISIYTRTNHKLTWLQLRNILSGLQVFMISQRSTLNFDIDIADDEEVAKGVIWYSPSRLPGANTSVKRALTAPEHILYAPNNTTSQPNPSLSLPNTAALLSPSTPYPLPSTPMTLHITLNGDTLPYLPFNAHLTTLLHRIHPNATTTPNAQIPWNEYIYSDGMSGMTFAWMGESLDDRKWLTWRQLSWIVQGVLGFVGEGEGNCRAMVGRVDISDGEAQWEVGMFNLWFVED